MTPAVTVLMPCYNASAFVDAAISSVRTQSYSDIEILAFDDGSTDSTAGILRKHAAQDRRIIVEHSDANTGLITVLNAGLDMARGRFIARLDADDLAAPNRVVTQLRFLAAHPDISLVGSASHRVDAATGHPIRPSPVRCFGPAGIRFMSLFANPIDHPTIMARSSIIRQYQYGGTPNAIHTEDYELFARMLSDGLRFANLPQPLVTRRIGAHEVSVRHEAEQAANFVMCARAHLARETGIVPSAGVHRVLVNRMNAATNATDLRGGVALLTELAERFLPGNDEDRTDFRRVTSTQQLDIVIQALRRGGPRVKAAAIAEAVANRNHLLAPDTRVYFYAKLLGRRPTTAVASESSTVA